jgi:hypothetical protein
MALFTDGLVSSIDDLSAQDSQLVDVANAENIDVTQKLALAQEEVALGLDALLTGMNYPDQLSWLAPQPSVHRVAVTPALRLWHTYRALEMVYADAYNSQLNDRYANKRDQFHSMASWAYDKLVRIGAGVVLDPIPKAVTPGAMAVAGAPGALPDATYYATMAWTNQAGEEGASASPATVSTVGGTLRVQPANPPKNAAGWNVYVGGGPDSMFRQNGTPIGTAQTWTQPGTLAETGRLAGQGQIPNYIKPVPRVIQRG